MAGSAAVSVLDSKASFLKHCRGAGLAESWAQAFVTQGVDTLGKLAYAVGVPGVQVSDDALTEFLGKVRPGSAPTLGDRAAISRTLFEAQTLTRASLRPGVQGEEAPKKVPVAERSTRLAEQAKRLLGLTLEGPLQPAYAIYDRFATMLSDGEVRYVPPEQCITREEELQGAKPAKTLQLDSLRTGLCVKDAEETPLTTSVVCNLALFQALTRRDLAADLVLSLIHISEPTRLESKSRIP